MATASTSGSLISSAAEVVTFIPDRGAHLLRRGRAVANRRHPGMPQALKLRTTAPIAVSCPPILIILFSFSWSRAARRRADGRTPAVKSGALIRPPAPQEPGGNAGDHFVGATSSSPRRPLQRGRCADRHAAHDHRSAAGARRRDRSASAPRSNPLRSEGRRRARRPRLMSLMNMTP